MTTLRNRLGLMGMAGGAVLLVVLAVAIVGPWVAPHGEEELLTAPYTGRGGDYLLGTDGLGRDVWSRILHGGRSTLIVTVAGVGLGFLIGAPLGAGAAYLRGLTGRAIVGLLDTLLVVPGLVLLLVVAAALGPGSRSILVVLAIFNAASVGRILYAAAQPVAALDFVQSAALRGQRPLSIVCREILPNVGATIGADIGVRFTISVLAVAGANFLGFGVQAPQADWGVMASENRAGLATQPLSVLAPVVMIALLSISVAFVAESLARKRTTR